VSSERKVLEKLIGHALSGKDSHVEAARALEGLDWKIVAVQPEGVPYSIFKLLSHLVYWQDWVVKWLDGEDPPIPKHADGSWPADTGPADGQAWDDTVKRFIDGIEELNRRAREAELFTKGNGKSRLEMLQIIASHNSYHLGQVVLLRQMLGTWPPPSGGLTW
jgi:hypothetical protein